MRKQSHQSKHARWGLHSVPAHPTLKLQLYTASLNNIQNDKWHYKPDIHHQSFFKEHPSSIMHVWIMWNQELPDSFTQPPASWCCLNDTCQPVFSQLPNLKKNNNNKTTNKERVRTGGQDPEGGGGGEREGRLPAWGNQPTLGNAPNVSTGGPVTAGPAQPHSRAALGVQPSPRRCPRAAGGAVW